jgi:hypothetical protein
MKVGFLEESEGIKSSTRLMFIIGTLFVLSICGYMVYTKAGNPIEIGTFLTMGVASFGGAKYFGTINENKKENKL